LFFLSPGVENVEVREKNSFFKKYKSNAGVKVKKKGSRASARLATFRIRGSIKRGGILEIPPPFFIFRIA
jgi:hypothetical protein